MFMNDELTEEILQDNAGQPDKQAFVQQMATPAYDYANDVPGPRVIKTHLPFSMLPPAVIQKRCNVVKNNSLFDMQILILSFLSGGLRCSQSKRCSRVILSFVAFVSDRRVHR